MLNIITVLKTGGFNQDWLKVDYKPEYVIRLKKQIEENITIPFRFICLSDVEIDGVETIPLKDDLKGWWSKIEIFREFNDFLYFDLDTTIIGNIDELANYQGFTAYQDFIKGNLSSAFLRVKGDYSFIYDDFIKNKDEIMKTYTTRKDWGDQKLIEDILKDHKKEFNFFDNKHFISYNFEITKGKNPTNESIIVYCGNLKPF